MRGNTMKNRFNGLKKAVLWVLSAALCGVLLWFAGGKSADLLSFAAFQSARLNLPWNSAEAKAAAAAPEEAESGNKPVSQSDKDNSAAQKEEARARISLAETPEDIKTLAENAKKASKNEKKDGSISDWTYTNEGVTDSFGAVRVKNTNKTKINIEKLLSQKADLFVDKKKPCVLIFHTHTSETFQLFERSWYPTGNITRSEQSDRNMVRIGKAICEELEKNGFRTVHDTEIHDRSYSGAYDRSRAAAVGYLKKDTSIQVVLDIHRDAIQRTDGTKIRPVAEIGGKRAAQVMIISGCQEEGNGIENFSDWQQNLVFALQLQKEMEESFPGLTRPLYFCPRDYNMNLTHCSLLLEVGSDSNTLEEAEYSGRLIGESLSRLLNNYTEEETKGG